MGLDIIDVVVGVGCVAETETVVCFVQGAMVEGNQVDAVGCTNALAK